MLQWTCKKVSIDFLKHAIPNHEQWCFRFLGVSWVLKWWWWFITFFIRGSIFLIHYMAHLIYIWRCNSCVGQVRCFIWICLNNTINLYIFHSASFLCKFCKLAFIIWLDGIWSSGYTSIATFFIYFRNVVKFWTFTWTATTVFTAVTSEQCSNEIIFFLYFLPQKANFTFRWRNLSIYRYINLHIIITIPERSTVLPL